MKKAVILSLAAAATAQQTAWGQCGGNGWSGQTTCVSGYYCSKQNDWYSQCIPGAATTTARPATSSARPTSTIRPTSTSTRTTLTTTVRPTSSAVVPASSSRPAAPSSSAAPPPSGSFAKANGLLFNIDGTTKYYAGSNSYWIGFLTNPADVDKALSQMQTNGLKILRVWGFNDVNTVPGSGTVYYQALVPGQQPVINTGANGLQRLDYVVQAAQKYGIKLIINFVNNWNDYGGMNAYVTYYKLASKNDWYTNTAAQTQYKAYIKAVVSRYATSTSVFAWELANEPRCNGCNTDVIYNWASSTSAYIKSLDSNHMVTLGDEGFGMANGDGSYPFGYSEGVDFEKNLKIPTLDFGTFHLYPQSWSTSNDWGNLWVTAHGAACTAANKPCLFEEYGITTAGQKCAVEGKWQTTALATKGIAGDLFWDLGVTLTNGNKAADDGHTIFPNTSDWTCLVTNHVAAIK